MTENTGMNVQETIEQNRDHYQEWIRFACNKLRRCKMRKLCLLYSPEDIVHEVIVKLSLGERCWDKKKYPDFHVYFLLLIKSHIDNLAGKEQHCINTSEDALLQCLDPNEEHNATFLLSLNLNDDFVEHCVQVLQHDIYCTLIFIYASAGMKNHEIAKEFQVSVSFVENAKKRIQRALHPLFEQHFEKKIELKV
jgi:DNA-directed RNA polymerase specialized sigma24 family protein